VEELQNSNVEDVEKESAKNATFTTVSAQNAGKN